MKETIGTVQYASLLYDFYGALLGESQAEVMTMYHEDNLSLSEIAEELGMSRQAVHYTLKKAEGKLEEFEEKLGLVASWHRDQEVAMRAAAVCGELERSEQLSEAGHVKLAELQSLISELTE